MLFVICLYCLSVCVSLSASISLEHLNTKFCVRLSCGRGSVLLWWRCDKLCTSGFIHDLTFGRNGPYGYAWSAVKPSVTCAIRAESMNVYEYLVYHWFSTVSCDFHFELVCVCISVTYSPTDIHQLRSISDCNVKLILMLLWRLTREICFECSKYRTITQRSKCTISWLQTADKHWQTRRYSVAVLHILVPHFSALYFGPAFSSPAFSLPNFLVFHFEVMHFPGSSPLVMVVYVPIRLVRLLPHFSVLHFSGDCFRM